MTHSTQENLSPDPAQPDAVEAKKVKKKPGFAKMIWSSLAMLVGVQSSKNHEEDFEAGIWHIVIVAFICALIFFFGIYGLVQIVMSNIE